MVNKERLDSIFNDMLKQKTRYEEELENLPEGYINIRMSGGRTYYTWQIPSGGRRRKVFRKGISRDNDMINKLVRKRYLDEALKSLDNNIKTLQGVLSGYKETDEEKILKAFVEKHPDLEGKIFQGKAENDEWASKYRKAVNFHEESLKSTTAAGARMRSKGEVIIASRLEFYDIPYRYEAPIEHPDVMRIPDFTIKRPRDNKIIYWEHLGMMNNGDYRRESSKKLSEYEEIDVTPWNNLILTYDQPDGGIDVRIIDALIQGWLI